MYQQMTVDAELWNSLKLTDMDREDYLNTNGDFWFFEGQIVDEWKKDNLMNGWEHEYYLEHGKLPDSWLMNEWDDAFLPVEWTRDEDTLEGYWRDL